MKKITVTNATVIPFYKKDGAAADEILRIHPSKNPDSTLKVVTFNIETKVVDDPEKRARLFERCVVYARNDDKVKEIEGTIKNGALVELQGYEERRKGTDDRFYNSIVVNKIIDLSGAQGDTPDDNLPF